MLKEKEIKILTVNIHKGFSAFNRNFVLHQLKDAIRVNEADLVFLQEVTGENQKHQKKYENWPESSHYEFLADEVWPEFAYGKNAVYPKGHHGNAILSKFPILESQNVDITTNRLEDRGFLYVRINIPDFNQSVHCICIHLGLWARSRKKQMKIVEKFILEKIPPTEPLIFAGDFNDWLQSSIHPFVHKVELKEAFLGQKGRFERTFPSWLPFLKLDRIYYRNGEMIRAESYNDAAWSRLTDHVALLATIKLKAEAV